MSPKQTRPAFESLKDWRETMAYTQGDAARLLGITQGFYSRLETGRLMPKPRFAQLVARKTGIPVLNLLGIAA